MESNVADVVCGGVARVDDDGDHDRVIHVDVDGYASRVPEARTRPRGRTRWPSR